MQTNSKLRMAIDRIKNTANSALTALSFGNYTSSYLWDIIGECTAALAELPRNCDIGTPVEQTTRFRKFCSAHKYLGSDSSQMCKGFGKGRCPFFNNHVKSKCEFAWAQMPYEEGSAK